MTKKRFLLIASFPLAIAMILGVIAMLTHESAVTKANFDRIEVGTTLAEVEAIFGREGEVDTLLQKPDLDWKRWKGSDGFAVVVFQNGCVVAMAWSDETLPEKIRRWLFQ